MQRYRDGELFGGCLRLRVGEGIDWARGMRELSGVMGVFLTELW